MLEEVDDSLSGRDLTSTAGFFSSLFEVLLKSDTGEDTIFADEVLNVFRFYRHDHAAVGKRGVAL